MKLVGKVKEAHGLKGELYILVFSGEAAWLNQLKKFYLKAPGATTAPHQEYEVKRAKPFKQGFIVKPQSIDDRNQSEALKGHEFYIDDDLLISNPGESIYLQEVLNFEIRDVAGNKLGTISGFSSNGVQDLLVVSKLNGEKAEVPFVKAFVKDIDFSARFLVVDLPEGLLDLESLED